MDANNIGNTDVVIRVWRTKVLNVFLTITVFVSIPALATVIIKAVTTPGMFALAISLSVALLILIGLAVLRRISFLIRVNGLLLIGYTAGIMNLLGMGFIGSGSFYLITVPVIALILLGKRAGFITSVISSLLSVTTAILVNHNIISVDASTRTPWMSLTTLIMFLTIMMTLLILFYRLQERLVSQERLIRTELVHTQTLLEEQNISLEQKIKERTDELLQSNKIQIALFKITEAASASRDMQEFYTHVHRIVGELMYAKNLFIALYDDATGLLSFPYFVDEKDQAFPTQPLENFHGMTSYVIRTGNPIEHGWDQYNQLVTNQEVTLYI